MTTVMTLTVMIGSGRVADHVTAAMNVKIGVNATEAVTATTTTATITEKDAVLVSLDVGNKKVAFNGYRIHIILVQMLT